MPANTRTSTTYGAAHQRRTRELKANLHDGDPCARGGEPLYRWQLDLPAHHPRSIDGDHVGSPVVNGEGALPDALSCAHHNRSHGARMGNKLRGRAQAPRRAPSRALPAAPITSRRW